MNTGRSSSGSLASVSVIVSMPGIRSECESGLYGKFCFIQLDVTKASLLAGSVPGRGAVTKVPVCLLDRE